MNQKAFLVLSLWYLNETNKFDFPVKVKEESNLQHYLNLNENGGDVEIIFIENLVMEHMEGWILKFVLCFR